MLGFLAINKGTTDDVKNFGRKLINNRVQQNAALMELASRKGVSVSIDQIMPTTPALAQLSQQSGAEFDKGIVKAVLNSEAKMQSTLQRYVGQVLDEDLREFANADLSDVRNRLSDARNLGSTKGLASQELNASLPAVGEEPGSMPTPAEPTPNPSP